MNIVTFDSPEEPETKIQAKKIDSQDPTEAQQASLEMAEDLQSEKGLAIVDDQPGKESIITNMNSEESKKASQIVSGYAVRHSLM